MLVIPGFMQWTMVLMAALIIVMIAVTVSLKLLRTAFERWHQANRQKLEPALEEFVATGGKQPALHAAGVSTLNRFLAPLMIERMTYLRGAGRQHMVQLAGELGIVSKCRSDLDSRNRWRRARAAERLGHFGSAADVEPLGKLLGDEDETVRAVAARSLAKLATPQAVELLVQTLDNPSELMRLRIAENLDRVGPAAVPYLVQLLEDAVQPGGQTAVHGPALAARVLGQIRSYEARPALRNATIKGNTPDIRAQAARALGRIGNPDDVQLLLECARDDEWQVRTQAAHALGYVGDISAIPALKQLVTDRVWWVRAAAGRALAGMGTGGEDALLELLAADDEYGRHRAAAALEASGATARFARELAGQGRRSTRAREAVAAIVQTGATRHLTDLLPQLDPAERQVLERLLSAAPAPLAPRGTSLAGGEA